MALRDSHYINKQKKKNFPHHLVLDSLCTQNGGEEKASGKLWKTNHHINLIYFHFSKKGKKEELFEA